MLGRERLDRSRDPCTVETGLAVGTGLFDDGVHDLFGYQAEACAVTAVWQRRQHVHAEFVVLSTTPFSRKLSRACGFSRGCSSKLLRYRGLFKRRDGDGRMLKAARW